MGRVGRSACNGLPGIEYARCKQLLQAGNVTVDEFVEVLWRAAYEVQTECFKTAAHLG